MTQFSELGLSQPLLQALAAEGYATPTRIQAEAIPVALAGRDLIGLAQTGAGKTAAFALPTLQRLAAAARKPAPRTCRTLVLAPTRELAAQIGEGFRTYGRFCNASVAVVYGGAAMGRQREALARGVDVLVATPGRLLDHVGQKSVSLAAVEILILDEADHMLDMGFIHALRRIADLLPAARQSLFFSATMPAAIAELAQRFLTDPARVAAAAPTVAPAQIDQGVIFVEQAGKADLLHDLLADAAITRAIVFTRTKHGADRVVKRLQVLGHEAAAIHGNKSQGQRERALAAFKGGAARVLVATEIAARGIDIDDVSHVINFDLPNVPEQYVHRIGRTARAGAAGRAISFCAPDERPYLKDIERLVRREVGVLARPPRAARVEREIPAAEPRARTAPETRRPAAAKPKRPARHGQRPPARGPAKAPAKSHAPRGGRDTVWSNRGGDRDG